MGLTVQITPGIDPKTTTVVASGSLQHVITDKEAESFGLKRSPLKSAVHAYFGKKPDDAYLKSPTPWHDLYKRYDWPEVQTILVAKRAELLSLNSKPAIIKTTTLKNTSSQPGTFSANVSDSVTNTFETNWNMTTNVEFSQSVNYSVEFAGMGSVGGSTSWSFGMSFGHGGSKSESVTVGSEQGVSVDLDPGESVEVQLTVSTGELKARIFYDVFLIGDTAVNYDPEYKGHHFWALNINDVMKAAKIETHHEITEDITVGYYSNAEVKLSNSKLVAIKAVPAELESVS